MAIKRETLVMVEEWKIKCFDLSNKPDYRDDPLVSVMLRGFDTLWIIANGCDSNRIRRALDSLECERSLCLRSENTGVTPIRTTMYGLIQSFHGILLDMTALKDTISVEIQTDEKSYHLSLELGITAPKDLISMETQTDEKSPLLSLEPVISLIKTSCNTEPKEVLMDKTTLQITRDPVEEIKEEVVENDDMNLHMDDGQLEVNNSTNEMSAIGVQDHPASKIITKATPENVKKPKEEPVDPTLVIPNLNQTTISEDMAAYYAIPEEEVDNFEINLGTEEWDSMVEDANENEDNQEENVNNDNIDMSKDSLDMTTRRISLRSANRTIKYDESDEDSEIAGPSMKKVKSESRKESNNRMKSHTRQAPVMKSVTKKERVSKDNDTELECPQCEYRTMNVSTWVSHLRDTHTTTPMMVGLALRCKCGHESFGAGHYGVCEISKITLVRQNSDARAKYMNRVTKKNGTELECPKCEFTTLSVCSWVTHLNQIHSTTPTKLDLLLRCDCGHESYSEKHNKVCKIANCTVIRKEDANIKKEVFKKSDTYMECPECEFRTHCVNTWLSHLRIHSTNPTKAGVLLRCECGNESTSAAHSRHCEVANFTVIRKEDAKVEEGGYKKSDTYMECPECEFRTQYVKSWLRHLCKIHSTNPIKAGVFLRCECGHECASEWHAHKCEIANFTVLRKSDEPMEESNNEDDEPTIANFAVLYKTDGPIQRLGEKKSLCEFSLDEMEEE